MLCRFSILVIVPLLSFMGCRTTSTLNLGNRSISSAEVQDMVRTYHTRIRSMKGEGRISVETPDIAQSGSFSLMLQKPDSVLITLQGPFGIKVGSALVTRTGFLFYNSLENKLISGSSSTENLNRILHIQAGFDDLVNLFAGGSFFEEDLRSPDEIRIEDDQWIFVYSYSKGGRRYWIDPATMSIQKVQFLDGNGKLTVEQTFSRFEDIQGFSMPYSIRITQPKAQQMLSLQYSDILVNVGTLPFTLTIPQNVERIYW
jgi:outer membrane lipoprotein-sorting protein